MTCDRKGCDCRSYEYVGENRREAHRIARGDGWKIGKPGENDYCKRHRSTKSETEQ